MPLERMLYLEAKFCYLEFFVLALDLLLLIMI